MFHLFPLKSAAATAAKSLQSCLTLCDPIDGSPPCSTVPGILQARTLEWVAISFSNAWKWKVKVKSLSRVWLLATPWTVAYQAPPPMGFSKHLPLHNCFISIFRCSILSVFMQKYLGYILLSYSTSHPLWNYITSIIRTNPKYNHFYFHHYHFCQVINISFLLQYYYYMWIGLLAYILHAAIQYQHRSQEVLWKQKSDHIIHLPQSL